MQFKPQETLKGSELSHELENDRKKEIQSEEPKAIHRQIQEQVIKLRNQLWCSL